MNDRTWGVLGIVFIALTIFTVLFAAQNPAARNAVSNAVDGTARPTSQAQSGEEERDTVVLDESETAEPTARPTDNNGNPITVIVPGVQQVLPTDAVDERDMRSPTMSPSPSMSPSASPVQ